MWPRHAYWNWSARFVRNATLAAHLGRITRVVKRLIGAISCKRTGLLAAASQLAAKKHLNSCFPTGYPLRSVCSLSVKYRVLVPLAGRSSLLLVRKLCINDAMILANFTRIFFSRMSLPGNISLVVCRGGGGTRT
jgi:hypothetical protein